MPAREPSTQKSLTPAASGFFGCIRQSSLAASRASKLDCYNITYEEYTSVVSDLDVSAERLMRHMRSILKRSLMLVIQLCRVDNRHAQVMQTVLGFRLGAYSKLKAPQRRGPRHQWASCVFTYCLTRPANLVLWLSVPLLPWWMSRLKPP